jgi:hypothetical protein
VNETPLITCWLVGAMTVLKLSVVGSAVAARLSVIETSAFGSAPWSPLPLTVEVVAQIVTVPSALTLPVRFRSPSVAGAHGPVVVPADVVTELFPVG